MLKLCYNFNCACMLSTGKKVVKAILDFRVIKYLLISNAKSFCILYKYISTLVSSHFIHPIAHSLMPSPVELEIESEITTKQYVLWGKGCTAAQLFSNENCDNYRHQVDFSYS